MKNDLFILLHIKISLSDYKYVDSDIDYNTIEGFCRYCKNFS